MLKIPAPPGVHKPIDSTPRNCFNRHMTTTKRTQVRTVNGYAMVAHSVNRFGEYVVLFAQSHPFTSTGYEYVVAYMGNLDDKSWYNGFYSSDFNSALHNYNVRAGNFSHLPHKQ